jgi:hypothetical protein
MYPSTLFMAFMLDEREVHSRAPLGLGFVTPKGELSHRLFAHWILDNNGLEVFSCANKHKHTTHNTSRQAVNILWWFTRMWRVVDKGG